MKTPTKCGYRMRILAIADIHESYDRVDGILKKEAGYDVIVIAGDVTTRGTIDEALEALRRFERYGKPVLAVSGNMDLASLDAGYEQLGVGMNARGVVLHDVGFFGVSGCPFTPMKTPNEVSEEEIGRRANAGWKDVQDARWKVFVPHTPPARTKLDKLFVGTHVGSEAIRTFVEERQPDVLICGHIHEARGVDTLGKTQMVNCGPAGKGSYVTVEIDEKIRVELRG